MCVLTTYQSATKSKSVQSRRVIRGVQVYTASKARLFSPFAMQGKSSLATHRIINPKGFYSPAIVLAICQERGCQRVMSLLRLEQLVFKRHVRFRLKSDTCTENVGESATLFGKSIDNRGTRRCERCL